MVAIHAKGSFGLSDSVQVPEEVSYRCDDLKSGKILVSRPSSGCVHVH